MPKCDRCQKEVGYDKYKNYVVKYHSWQAYNCCSEDCARKCANSDGIDNDEIDEVE